VNKPTTLACRPVTSDLMSDDNFDDIPDDFAHVQDIDWAHLLAGPVQPTAADSTQPELEIHSMPVHSNGLDNDSYSSYFSDGDEMDASFLAELDRVEQRIIGARVARSLQISGKVVVSRIS